MYPEDLANINILKFYLKGNDELKFDKEPLNLENQKKYIISLFDEKGKLLFKDLIKNLVSRFEIILTFLAVLDLIKEKVCSVFQNTIYGKIIGEIKNNNVVKIEKCKIDWCLIKKNEHAGWISKNHLWGVKQKETFNISFFQLFIDFF